MVKSQYGRVSFGFTTWRLCSKVLDSITCVVKKPTPSWNCECHGVHDTIGGILEGTVLQNM